jgi:hypothetical protein
MGLSMREEEAVKAEEAGKGQEFLGYEALESGPVIGASPLSRKYCGAAVVVLVALLLLGVVYITIRHHDGESWFAMGEPKQTISEDIPATAFPSPTDDSLVSIRANDEGPAWPAWSPSLPKSTAYCLGYWYPIVAAFYACPGE